jgi:hypothetical protein
MEQSGAHVDQAACVGGLWKACCGEEGHEQQRHAATDDHRPNDKRRRVAPCKALLELRLWLFL